MNRSDIEEVANRLIAAMESADDEQLRLATAADIEYSDRTTGAHAVGHDKYIRVWQRSQHLARKQGDHVQFQPVNWTIDEASGTAAAQLILRQSRANGDLAVHGSIFITVHDNGQHVQSFAIQHSSRPIDDVGYGNCIFCRSEDEPGG